MGSQQDLTGTQEERIKKHHCFVTETVMVTHVGRDEQQGACKIQWKQAEMKPKRDIKQDSLRRAMRVGAFLKSIPRELQICWGCCAGVGHLPSRCEALNFILSISKKRKGGEEGEGRG